MVERIESEELTWAIVGKKRWRAMTIENGNTNGHIGVSVTEVLRKYPYILGKLERIHVHVAGNY